MAIRSSRMQALTNPSRFGLEVVREFFGQVRRAYYQNVVLSGEWVRVAESGELACIYEFVAYENGQVYLSPVDGVGLRVVVNRSGMLDVWRA